LQFKDAAPVELTTYFLMFVPVSAAGFILLFTNPSLIHSRTKGSNQNPSGSQRETRAGVREAFSHLNSGCVVFGREMHTADTVLPQPSPRDSESASYRP